MSSENEKTKNAVTGGSNVTAGGNVHIGDIVHIHEVKKEAAGKETKITSEKVEEIRNYIKRSRIKNALEEMLKVAEETDEDLHDQIIVQSERWNKLQKDERLGIISMSDAGVVRTRIVNNLISLLHELEAFEK